MGVWGAHPLAVAYHLYEVKGWPVIAWDEERGRYARHRHVGSFEDGRAMVRVYDEMAERAWERAMATSTLRSVRTRSVGERSPCSHTRKTHQP